MKTSQILPQFLDWLQFTRNASPSTVRFREKTINQFLKDMGDLKIKRIDLSVVQEWKKKMSERNLQPRTFQNYLITLRLFLKFCNQQKQSQMDIVQITLPKSPKKEVVFLENDEIQQFIVVVKNLKHRAIVECLLGTGARISELLNLNRNDIVDNKAKVIGKGNKERTIIFSKRASEWLNKYLKTRKDNYPSLFSGYNDKRISRGTVENFFKKYWLLSGLKKRITPHTLRRTFTSNMLLNNANVIYVAQLLGDSDLKVLMDHYAGLNQKKLQQVHQKYLNYER